MALTDSLTDALTPSRLPAALRRGFWRGTYELLPRGFPRQDWTCMNYGYDAGGAVGPLPPERECERACLALYARLLEGVELRGLRLVEVGSGRGGGLAWAHGRGAAEATGVDFSRAAVAWCRERHRAEGLRFVAGDAEALPLEDGRADVVINVESSHCYGDIGRFLREVRRVLAPGGRLLLTDFQAAGEVEGLLAAIRGAGLEVSACEDITAGVLAALDADQARRRAWISQARAGWLSGALARFSGVPGTAMYEAFADGSSRYLRIAARPA